MHEILHAAHAYPFVLALFAFAAGALLMYRLRSRLEPPRAISPKMVAILDKAAKEIKDKSDRAEAMEAIGHLFASLAAEPSKPAPEKPVAAAPPATPPAAK